MFLKEILCTVADIKSKDAERFFRPGEFLLGDIKFPTTDLDLMLRLVELLFVELRILLSNL